MTLLGGIVLCLVSIACAIYLGKREVDPGSPLTQNPENDPEPRRRITASVVPLSPRIKRVR